MLSRRILRIKVMQNLYAFNLNKGLALKGTSNNLQNSIDNAYRLYLYNMLTLIEVSKYVLIDNKKRLTKMLRNTEASVVSTALYDNPIMQALRDNEALKAEIKRQKIIPLVDIDVIRNIFKDLRNHKEYQSYINTTPVNITFKQHKNVVKTLFKRIMLKNDVYTSHIEDNFINWYDDAQMTIAAVTTCINNYTENDKAIKVLRNPNDWNVKVKFAVDLLKSVLENEEACIDLIKPQLKNWEIERVTKVDTILLQMALCELLYFPTIPVKVTLNEYIEVAKQYSTPKSKDFVNGILDKLMKQLQEASRIRKKGRGLVEF